MHAMSMTRSIVGAGVGRWALVGLALYVVGWFAAYFLIDTLARLALEPSGLRPEPGTVGWSLRNGIHEGIWGLLVAAAAIPIGRRLVSRIAFERTGATVLLMGLVLASVTELLLNEFVLQRYGMFDTEYAGLAVLAAPAVVATALASWAAMSVPREVRAPLLVLAAAAAVGFGLALLPSITGLADGLDPASSGLAASLIGDGIFVVLALVIARR